MSKKSTTPLNETDPQMSKEEMSKRREEITEFYKDNIPHLEIQADYEMLLAAIEKARAERMKHKCLWLNSMQHKKKEE